MPQLLSCLVCKKSAKINRTSGGCVTAPDLGDSLWQGHKNPQFLKIDKLVYSHAVNCLIAKPTNRKLKVTVLPGNEPSCSLHLRRTDQTGATAAELHGKQWEKINK